jgi:hypothetical protein
MSDYANDKDEVLKIGGAAAGGYGGAVIGTKAGCAVMCATAPVLGPLAPLLGLAVAIGSTVLGGKLGYDNPEAGLMAGLGGAGANMVSPLSRR